MLKQYDDAVRLNPEDAGVRFRLGGFYAMLSRWKEVAEEFEEAIRLNPDDAKAHYNLGSGHFKTGHLGLERYEEAISAHKEAFRLKPDLAEAHCGLGAAYMALGKHGAALHQYRTLRNLDSTLAD